MHSTETLLSNESVDKAIDAGLDFWRWYNTERLIQTDRPINPDQIFRVATETISLHLPETMVDSKTLNSIVGGTFALASVIDGTRSVEIFNDMVLELSAEPTTTLDDLPEEIFRGEDNRGTKIVLYDLAKIAITPPPLR